jgi:hypothetical protein
MGPTSTASERAPRALCVCMCGSGVSSRENMIDLCETSFFSLRVSAEHIAQTCGQRAKRHKALNSKPLRATEGERRWEDRSSLGLTEGCVNFEVCSHPDRWVGMSRRHLHVHMYLQDVVTLCGAGGTPIKHQMPPVRHTSRLWPSSTGSPWSARV